MDSEELEDRIESFARWQYRFEFPDGVRTRVSHEGQANRHVQRRRYFFEALLRLTGGSLQGKRILDLGCNAGYWSLQAAEAGAEFVLGIDAQQEAIEQAELIFEAKGIDRARYRFDQANAFGHPIDGSFDIVLCLAFMDVTARPVELFELMTGVGADLIVIDTAISRVSSSFFEVGAIGDSRTIADRKLTLVPSWQAVIEMAGEFGLQIAPLAIDIEDFNGLEDYQRGRRMAFICSTGPSLDGVARAPAPGLVPWWLSRLNPLT